MNLLQLKQACEDNNLYLNEEQLNKFNTYAQFLKEYNQKINLTAILEDEQIIEKHFYDCLIGSFNVDLKGTLVDVGTGAGFPGVVLKIAYPELKVILVEPLKKRCIFLSLLIDLLKLKDIEVINQRGEHFTRNHREKYDYATARAVTNMAILIEITGALVKNNGYFIAYKGLSGKQEIQDATNAINTMGFEVENIFDYHLSDHSTRTIGLLKKVKKSPNYYPRNYATIKKQPL